MRASAFARLAIARSDLGAVGAWLVAMALAFATAQAPVWAQDLDPLAQDGPDHSQSSVWKPAAAPEGGISWELLSTTIEETVELEDGTWILPEFPEAVASLNDTEITIAGFMMPLQNSEKQSHFLLMAYPPDCPFCMSAGPRYLMEVMAPDAIPFNYNTLTLTGRLELLEKDETGLFFRLHDARSIEG